MKHKGICLVGTGQISHVYAKVLKRASSNFKGVYGRDFQRTMEFAKKYGLKYYSSLEEVLRDNSIDTIIITTSNDLHAKYAILSAKAGKNILIEKPMATNSHEAKQIIESCKENNVKLAVISNYRTSLLFKRIKARIISGELGKIIFLQATIRKRRTLNYYNEGNSWKNSKKSSGGGVLMMNALHIIDLFLWLFGEISSVNCKTLNIKDSIDVEDTAIVQMNFKNGVIANLNCTTAAICNSPDTIEIHGTKGFIIVSGNHIKLCSFSSNPIKNMISSVYNSLKKYDKDPIKIQVNNFIDAIDYNRQLEVTAESGYKVVSLIEDCYLSSEQKREIKVK